MQPETLDFIAKIAWPAVALIAVVILGPFGVLSDIADRVLGITKAVKDFEGLVKEFHGTQQTLQQSSGWVQELKGELGSISLQITTIRSMTLDINKTTQDLVMAEGSRSLSETVSSDGLPESEREEILDLSVEEMHDDIWRRWYELTDQLKERVGPENFDARSIGAVARRHVDGRRNRRLTSAQADLFERLHEQIKRFTRLKSTRGDWLTREVYTTFVRGVEQATTLLASADTTVKARSPARKSSTRQ